jgi:hypothetical protein
MKCGTQAALAIGAGYLLGRRRKMRLATMAAAAAATGGLGRLGGPALQRGIKMLGSTEALGKFAPQLTELADTVRGDLIDAGKAAATAAVSNRIESLTDSLHERAEMVRDPGAAVGDAGKAARSGAGEATGRLRRRGKRAAGDEEGDEPRDEEEPEFDEADYEEGDEPEADEPEADEPEAEEPAPRRRRATARRSPDGPEADEREAAPPRRRATTRRRSPVARAGR